MKKLFDPLSLKFAPEKYFQDPNMAKIYEESMIEAMTGTDNGDFKLVKVMEKMKEKQVLGYEYHVYEGEDVRPRGVCQSLPSQQYKNLPYGDVVSCNGQLKYKNTLGWIYWSMAGTNGERTLENFCDALTFVESDHFQVWALRKTYQMSGRPLNSIKVTPVDGKLSEEYLCKEISGEYKNSNSFASQPCKTLICDKFFYLLPYRTFTRLSDSAGSLPLKNSIWPKQLSENLHYQIKEHPEVALSCTTKEDYDFHVQQTYEALAEYPLHASYFKKRFDKPKSIAKYKIMKVRVSLSTILSSNSESLDSSNESFMPTVTMGIMAPDICMYDLTKCNDEWVL